MDGRHPKYMSHVGVLESFVCFSLVKRKSNKSNTIQTTRKRDNNRGMVADIIYLCAIYEEPSFQERLNRLYADLGEQHPERWAQQIYLTLRDEPFNERAHALNMDHKTCLKLAYDLVDAWEASPDPDLFEQQIYDTFQVFRLKRILYIGLVMDRAQSLYHMKIPSSPYYGMHWYSKHHLARSQSDYHSDYLSGGGTSAFEYFLSQYAGAPTMNRRLFKLLHTQRLGLLQDAHLAHWSQPTLATFVKVPHHEHRNLAFHNKRSLSPAAARVSPKLKSLRM